MMYEGGAPNSRRPRLSIYLNSGESYPAIGNPAKEKMYTSIEEVKFFYVI